MSKRKVALITGVTGQDGAYLADFLLNKGYIVHGMRRRVSSLNIDRIMHLVDNEHKNNNSFYLHYGDMTDSSSILRIVQQTEPDEIYNLAAQSHVHVSFESPEYTANADAIGALRVLEAIKILKLEKKTKFYQASTSELFGKIQEPIQSEVTPFYPRSPYAVAKLYAYWISVNYREAYGIYACNGILFNHESPTRGETFVTRKITSALAKIAFGKQDRLSMGNLDAERDWGHAKDYVEMQWLMLQQENPKDYVIATGVKHSVREFIELAANYIGINVRWKGKGLSEIGFIESIDRDVFQAKVSYQDPKKLLNKEIINIDAFYYRPTEVEMLLGDAKMAKNDLGWEPKINFEDLVFEMMDQDILIESRKS